MRSSLGTILCLPARACIRFNYVAVGVYEKLASMVCVIYSLWLIKRHNRSWKMDNTNPTHKKQDRRLTCSRRGGSNWQNTGSDH